MYFLTILRPLTTAVAGIVVLLGAASCGTAPDPLPMQPVYRPTNSTPVNVSSKPALTPTQLYRMANVHRDLIPNGHYARRYHRYMNPHYITIHSTQNFAPSADAWQHSKALKHGKLRARKLPGGNRIGYLVWHYSIDQYRVVQHLPDNEQGEHADFNGPGNNYSLGLEMCENRGNNRAATMNRTAKLAAYLMYKHNIPLRNVVPHYHWARHGLHPEHKNCPYYLLDNGRPGRKWRAFQNLINYYYQMLRKPANGSNAYLVKHVSRDAHY